MWGEADRVTGGALSGTSAYPATSRHGKQHRPRLASAVRGVGDLSSTELRRSYWHCNRSLGHGDATRHAFSLLDGAIASLSSGGYESCSEPGAADLCHPPARP